MLNPAQTEVDFNYKTVKTATANTTFASQLAELRSAYNTLGVDRQRRTIILYGFYQLRNTHSGGIFDCQYMDSAGLVNIVGMNLSAEKAFQVMDSREASTNRVIRQLTDMSNTSYAGSLVLVIT